MCGFLKNVHDVHKLTEEHKRTLREGLESRIKELEEKIRELRAAADRLR